MITQAEINEAKNDLDRLYILYLDEDADFANEEAMQIQIQEAAKSIANISAKLELELLHRRQK